MQIVHIVESFAGGVYDFLVDLTNGLPEFNHIIIHGLRNNTPKNFKQDFPKGTNFFLWKNAEREVKPLKDLLALKELIKLLQSINNIDVIHLHSSKAGFLGRVAAKILGLQNKVIYTSHGVSFLRKDISLLKRKQFEIFEKIASKLGGNVIACSKSEAEEFRKRGIQADFIFNGIDLNKCNVKKSNVKKGKLQREPFIIGTIGRITYQKNHYLFNEIAKFFEKENIKFIWIGDGELKETLTAKNIIITGWVPRKKVLKLLNRIDIYLSTSLWEGLPLSVLQAMCLKKPLLLSECVGNVDLINNGSLKNGFLFKNKKEAIEKIFLLKNNYQLRKFLGNNSFKILKEKFDLKKTLEEYRRIYLKTIEQKEE
jgi:glycosyltransferase involved in cell wall biosynthesis